MRGNEAAASALVLLVSALVIGVPVLGLFSLVAVEAVRVGQSALPWLEERLRDPGALFANLPPWLTIPDALQPYTNRIVEQIGQWVSTAGRFIVQYVSKATQGTLLFVVKQFLMLYSEPEIERIARVAFEVAGLEGAAFWGALVVPVSAMPLVGPPIIWGPAGIYLLAQGEVIAGVGLLMWGTLIVGTIDNILRPRLVGGDTKMSDLLILISTLGGLGAFGPVGIILGPVLAGVLITVLDIYRDTPEFHYDDEDEERESASDSDRADDRGAYSEKTP